MSINKVIQDYYYGMNCHMDLMVRAVNSYKLLTGAAIELNSIALAHKKDVRDAIKRANKLGDIIDDMLSVYDSSCCHYNNYLKLKSKAMVNVVDISLIKQEIEINLNEIEINKE